MASTYSATLGLELMANGENSSTWGTKTNNNLSPLLETSIAGYTAVNFATDADTTIAINNGTTSTGRYLILNLTSSGSLTATRDLLCPLNAGKWYMVLNNTSGAQSIRVKGATGTGITIPTGKRALVYCDGTNYGSPITYFPDSVSLGTDLAVVGDLTVGDDVAITGDLTVTGVGRIDGNLGLDVTPSAWGSNYPAIQVGAGGALWGTAAAISAVLSSNLYYDGTNYKRLSTAVVGYYNISGNIHTWLGDVSGTAGANFTPTQRMQLDGANLYIGASSVSGSRSNTAITVSGAFRTSRDVVSVANGGGTIPVSGLQVASSYMITAYATGSGGVSNATYNFVTGDGNVAPAFTLLARGIYTGSVVTITMQNTGGVGQFSFGNGSTMEIVVGNSTGGAIDVEITFTRLA